MNNKWYDKFFTSGARAWFNYSERLKGKDKKAKIKIHLAGVIGTIAAGLVWSFFIFCIWAFVILFSNMNVIAILSGGLVASLLWSLVSFKVYKRKTEFFEQEKETIDDYLRAAKSIEEANIWDKFNRSTPVVFRTDTDKTIQ